MPLSLPLDLPLAEAGDAASRTALILHGGGGPRTVAPLAAHLTASLHVLTPTHPGWDGTTLPAGIGSVADLAAGYLQLLHDRQEHDVVLIGSSLGGWIALEMAVQAAADDRWDGIVGALVLIDGVGVIVDGAPIADFFALDARGLAERAWHDPERGYVDPATLTDEQRTILVHNRNTMATIASGMGDVDLLGRLGAIEAPALVVWGDSDRIVTPAYGRALADALADARFVEIPAAGHLPQLEAPDATWAALDPFLEGL